MSKDMDWRTWMQGENRTIDIQRNYGDDRSTYPHRGEARMHVDGQFLHHVEIGTDPDDAANKAVAGLRNKLRDLLDET